MHKIANLWKFELNRSSNLRDNNERKKHPCHTKLCAFRWLILRPQVLNLRSRYQISGKLFLSRKLWHFRGIIIIIIFFLTTRLQIMTICSHTCHHDSDKLVTTTLTTRHREKMTTRYHDSDSGPPIHWQQVIKEVTTRHYFSDNQPPRKWPHVTAYRSCWFTNNERHVSYLKELLLISYYRTAC